MFTGEEFDSHLDSMLFEDGLLHDDVESVSFEDKPMLLDIIDEGAYSGKMGCVEDDDELLEFFGNQLLAYGGGNELDYISIPEGAEDSVLLSPEQGTKKQNMADASQIFYEDIVDLYWLNSS